MWAHCRTIQRTTTTELPVPAHFPPATPLTRADPGVPAGPRTPVRQRAPGRYAERSPTGQIIAQHTQSTAKACPDGEKGKEAGICVPKGSPVDCGRLPSGTFRRRELRSASRPGIDRKSDRFRPRAGSRVRRRPPPGAARDGRSRGPGKGHSTPPISPDTDHAGPCADPGGPARDHGARTRSRRGKGRKRRLPRPLLSALGGGRQRRAAPARGAGRAPATTERRVRSAERGVNAQQHDRDRRCGALNSGDTGPVRGDNGATGPRAGSFTGFHRLLAPRGRAMVFQGTYTVMCAVLALIGIACVVWAWCVSGRRHRTS